MKVPSGPEWDAFRRDVIKEFASPKFDGWDHIDENASFELVGDHAGVFFSHEISYFLIHNAILCFWRHTVAACCVVSGSSFYGPHPLA